MCAARSPILSHREVRQHPMMQGVYQHLRAHESGKLVARKGDVASLSPTDQMAYLSQNFFSLGVMAGAVSFKADASTYDKFIAFVDNLDTTLGIRPFSTSDIAGFSLCLIMWISFEMNDLTGKKLEYAQKIIDYFIKTLGLTSSQQAEVDQAIHDLRSQFASLQYRNPPTGYGHASLDNDARVIMLGDWGTSMDDAAQLLEAIWEQTFQDDNDRDIVFVHLGDIYYAGLPVECERNFHQVFKTVGQTLSQRLGSKFNANPRIYTIPGNHEYYSYGYGYYQMIDTMNSERDTGQSCSFFCLRTDDNKWQFLGMDTGQDDYNALTTMLESVLPSVESFIDTAIEVALPWPLDSWAEKWVNDYLDGIIGPFPPQLRSQELAWHQARISELSHGQTLLMSHHQGYSNVAQINYKSPEFINKGLMENFQPYFDDSIAAWFWGHEHSYAIFKDGSFGLNKGRLLGSSSYEATEAKDHPYTPSYAQVQFADDMKEADQSGGFYDHACAVFDFKRKKSGDSIKVTYYEYPSWGLHDSPPANRALSQLYSEHISSSRAKAPSSYWYGNKQVHSGHCETHHRPALTKYGRYVMMTWKDADDGKIHWASNDLSEYDPINKTWPSWNDRGSIDALKSATSSDTQHIYSDDATALAVLGNQLVLAYTDKSKDKSTSDYPLQWAIYRQSDHNWVNLGDLTLGGNVVYSKSGPALATFGDQIYMVYRSSQNNDRLYWARYSLASDPSAAGTWTDLGSD